MFLRNENAHPAFLIGVARTLTWTNGGFAQVRSAERRLFRTLSRIITIASDKFYLSGLAIADALGVREDGALFCGNTAAECRDWLRRPEISRSATSYFLVQLRQAMAALYELTVEEHQVALALRRYKLALEVDGDATRAELRNSNERMLQMRLARFLIERGMHVIGTKFGRNETDLVLNAPGETHVLEVKLYRRTPTAKQVMSNLTQLVSYMDQAPVRPTGILVLYNLSNRPILGPATATLIRERYIIVAINVGDASASKRRSSLVVEHGRGEPLIDVLLT